MERKCLNIEWLGKKFRIANFIRKHESECTSKSGNTTNPPRTALHFLLGKTEEAQDEAGL